jgi:hypothetical protein
MTRNRVEEFIAAIAKMIRVTSGSVKSDNAYRWETVQDAVEDFWEAWLKMTPQT